MSTVVIDGLDSRTTGDTVQNFCQNYGRILNCYMKSNQCIVTFAEKHNAEEFLRASPHRIDSTGLANVTWKTTLNRTLPHHPRSTDQCRLTIRGTFEQLEEKTLLRYFSHYGHVRLCLANPSQGCATITFDDRTSCERILKEPRHFLNGRSLIIEPYTITTTTTTTVDEPEPTKRMKYSDPNDSTLAMVISRFEHEKEQLVNERTHLQTQYQERIQLHEYEKQQLSEFLTKQQAEFHQQIGHYQYLLKQSLDELINKDKQIAQLKQENKDIDDLLRQSVHDNEQQQIHLKKREEIHSQTKKKYEELYKAYMKLKDNCAIQRDKEKDPIDSTNSNLIKPRSTIDDVRKKTAMNMSIPTSLKPTKSEKVQSINNMPTLLMSSSSLKCQILLRNLSKRTTAKQLQQYATRYGSVLDCYLTENDSEGFIEFNDRASVDVFMAKRPHSIDGNELQCQRCLPSHELQKPVKRIFVRGTIQQLTDNRLANYFSKYGKVLSCTIPKGKRNSTFTHFGYGFVAFDDEDVIDRIIQDKPHYMDEIELEIEKAEDMARNRRHSHSRSPSSRSSRSVSMNDHKRIRRQSPSPQPIGMKRPTRPTEVFPIRQLEEENRRLREHAMMTKHHFDENMWKLRRELDDERRRHDQLKVEYDHLRRELARVSTELQQKSSTKQFNSNNKRDLSSRH